MFLGSSAALFFSIQQQNQLDKKISKIENQLESANKEIQGYQTEIASLRKKLESANKKIQDYQAEIASLRKQLSSSNSSNTNSNNSKYSFNSVEALLKAIKKDPTAYNNVQIKVVGSALKGTTTSGQKALLFDLPSNSTLNSDFDYNYWIWRLEKESSHPQIYFTLTDNIQFTVLSSGDYIKVTGTVRIANNQIYLDNCSYEFAS